MKRLSVVPVLLLWAVLARDSGAEDWWSLQKLERPPVPKATENPIDAFVLAKLGEHQLEMSAPADRRTLIRRVYFNLWGLPPAPDVVEAFVADPDPDAYRKLADRLLESPRYGERWARHWLDVVHFGETHGYDKDQPRPNAWPYRDYVILAFNEDKPYARFVREQLAGDVLFPDSTDGIVATGFLAAGPWDLIGHAEVPEEKIDGQVARHLDRDDMVTTTMNTFTSLTVQCAQCHKHKRDPVEMADYYSLQAVFAALDRADRSYDVDPAVTERRKKLEARRAQLAPAASERYGYHSKVAKKQATPKWVQVDLGERRDFDKLSLYPAAEYGFADFGFPHRFKIEVADRADFSDRKLLHDATASDQARPGSAPVVIERATTGRYLRVTATKLWSRRKAGQPLTEEWIFALGELQIHAGDELQKVEKVTALDSIEALPRWGKADLIDGEYASPSPELERIKAQLAKLQKPKTVYAGTVHNGSGNFKGRGHAGGKPRDIHVLLRGDVTKPGVPAQPGSVPGIVAGLPSRFELAEDHAEGARRVALADWIVHQENTLTWRSIVNRIWHYHFGRGIVDTPNDFGRLGGLPSHPQLLDWLAVEFRDDGGSVKDLHRLILNSATYKQSSAHHAEHAARDSSNRFLWRQNRRRLEAEALRDSVLTAAGKMNLKMGGPSFRDFVLEKPQHSPHYQYHKHDPDDAATHRRSIYRFIVRSQPQPFMETLDCADPSQLVDKRSETTTALQALALLNNRFMVRMSTHFAQRVKEGADPVATAFALALSRQPSPAELDAIRAYATEHGLAAACRVIFNMSEFSFID